MKWIVGTVCRIAAIAGLVIPLAGCGLFPFTGPAFNMTASDGSASMRQSGDHQESGENAEGPAHSEPRGGEGGTAPWWLSAKVTPADILVAPFIDAG